MSCFSPRWLLLEPLNPSRPAPAGTEPWAWVTDRRSGGSGLSREALGEDSGAQGVFRTPQKCQIRSSAERSLLRVLPTIHHKVGCHCRALLQTCGIPIRSTIHVSGEKKRGNKPRLSKERLYLKTLAMGRIPQPQTCKLLTSNRRRLFLSRKGWAGLEAPLSGKRAVGIKRQQNWGLRKCFSARLTLSPTKQECETLQPSLCYAEFQPFHGSGLCSDVSSGPLVCCPPTMHVRDGLAGKLRFLVYRAVVYF